MRLARILVAVAAFAAAAVLVPSVAHARGTAAAWHGGGGWHGGTWHGGYWHGGYYRPCCYYGGYWPFWGGVAIGASVGYWGGYWGGYYPAYYYPPAYSYYEAPPGGAMYSEDMARGGDGQPAPQTIQPAPQSSRGRPVPQAAAAAEPIFYPRNGQSAEQTEADRRDCNRWATTQRGAMGDASIFQRATFACMEGRGYTVR
jgi:hypothetical protein